MKNAEVLRMAKALLTPAVEDEPTEIPDDSDDGSGGGSDGGVGSLPDDGVATLALTPDYTAVTPTFSMKDPIVLERLQALLELSVELLICLIKIVSRLYSALKVGKSIQLFDKISTDKEG